MLHLTLPAGWLPERRWIADVILNEFLGLEYEIEINQSGEAVHVDADGKTLTLSDAFFANDKTSEFTTQNWHVVESGLEECFCAPSLPILFGGPGFAIDSKGNAALSLDIFGSAFFMLARYEELTRSDRDNYDRFPAEASLAARMGFLGRPIIDEYVEILWGAMKRLWPRLERKQRSRRTLVSCDVDLPFDPACASMWRLGKRLSARVYRERSFEALASCIGNYCAVQRGEQDRDPYRRALTWIMDVNERVGNQVTFNFIPEPTDRVKDNAPSLDDPRIRELLRIVHARGHLIGLHPGYNTYRHLDVFSRSVSKLRHALEQEGIEQDELGGRQHYLRWDVSLTPRLWDASALSYDSTLGYATVAGFRAGTCHEYTMYDLIERRPLNVKQRPLIVMENAVIDDSNMGLGHGEAAFAAMEHYKGLCNQFDGDFTLLWHNSSLTNEMDKSIYCNLIN